MNIAIIGIGGVGGYYGGRLTTIMDGADHTHVHFVARGEHLEAIRTNGLILDSEEGILECRPTSATLQPAHRAKYGSGMT